MKNSNFLQDLITSIIDRGAIFSSWSDDREISELCQELLSSRGEVSSRRIGSAVLNCYQALDREERVSFFKFLNEQMDLDVDAIAASIDLYRNDRSVENMASLSAAAEAPRQELLRRLNHVPGATSALVSMRRDLLDLLPDYPELKRMDLDFSHLFASWFNRGFLVIRPIPGKVRPTFWQKSFNMKRFMRFRTGMICGAGCNRMTDAVLLSFTQPCPTSPWCLLKSRFVGAPRIPCRKSYGTIGMS